MEEAKSKVNNKFRYLEEDFDLVEGQLRLDDADVEQLEADFAFLKRQVNEFLEASNRYLTVLMKDPSKQQEVEDETKRQRLVVRRFTSCELQMGKLLSRSETSPRADPADTKVAVAAPKTSLLLQHVYETLREEYNKFENATEALFDDSPLDTKLISYNLEVISGRVSELKALYNQLLTQFLSEGDTDAYLSLRHEWNCLQDSKAVLEKRYCDLSGISTLSSTQSTATHTRDNFRMKFPKRELVKFSGDVRDWLPFWAFFKVVHEDPKLPTMDKFHVLLQSLGEGSPAQKLVKSFPVAAKNYDDAVTSLKDRYGRENVLVKVYVRDLLKLVVENASGKKTDFTDLVTQLTSQIRNLDTLGVTEDHCEQILYPVVESCLPEEVMVAWQRSTSFKEELTPLLEFLQTEVNNETERTLALSQFGSLTSTSVCPKSEKKVRFSKDGKKSSDTPTSAALVNAEKTTKVQCYFCDKAHYTADCRKGVAMSLQEKTVILQQKNVCPGCFRKAHQNNCKSKPKCFKCGGNHFVVMCPDLDQKGGDNGVSNMASSAPVKMVDGDAMKSTELCNLSKAVNVPLHTIMVTAFGADGQRVRVRAMFDSGSQNSYVVTKIARLLHLQSQGEEEVIHQTFGGVQSPPQRYQVVKLVLANSDGSNGVKFDVRAKDVISPHIVAPRYGPWIDEFEKFGVRFSDLENHDGPIDVLIGNDVRAHLFTNRVLKLPSGPVAEETIWGWVLSGKLPTPPTKSTSVMLVTNLQVSDRPLADLWSLDTIGIRDACETQKRDEIEAQTLQHFSENIIRLENGRYEVSLPWLSGMKERLPNNFDSAVQRLKGTTKKLNNEGYLQQYHSVLQQWLQEGMIEEVAEVDARNDGKHYLPHRAVIKASSSTTPVRPVFDASAKLRSSPSLNDCVDKGANDLELIPSILTRFRMYSVGAVADIKKAFQQISVSPGDRDYLRFLWWEDTNSQRMSVFRHTRVVFGVTCSPFLLSATLNYHINSLSEELGSASSIDDGGGLSSGEIRELLSKSLYVDNCVISLPSHSRATQFKEVTQELLLPACFDLRGWELGPNGEDREVNVLGLQWNLKDDHLSLDVSAALERLKACEVPTQRVLLAVAHMLFDPLGIASPFILQAKLLLRQCHEYKLGWDTPLPAEIVGEFGKWGASINYLMGMKIPRHVHFEASEKRSLHVFCDGSSVAYATAVFLRVDTGGEVFVSLLQSKSRVAPKKRCTIPRLELVGCLIGARLLHTVLDDLDHPAVPVTIWSDSTTALAWVRGDGPWGPFVQNRKSEINNLTELSWWRHIPGRDNPADLPSRGCSARKLVDSRWWEGPHWLRLPFNLWPISNEGSDAAAVEAEKRKTVVSCLTTEEHHPLTCFLRTSHFPSLLRNLAYWLRYRQVLMNRALQIPVTEVTANISAGGPPTTAERIEAEKVLWLFVQEELQGQPKKLKKLWAYKDDQGLLRTRTKLTHEDTEDFLRPIILPQKNPFVMLLIRWEHEKTSHAGTNMLLAHLRERFWIINGRRTVRSVVGKCFVCKRYTSRAATAIEGSLPPARTEQGQPFSVVGVDAAGPLFLKNKQKVWILLFTCGTYRAVHMEVVDTLSTDGFLRAFRRFVARRNRPRVVYSDNALNFTGAIRAMEGVEWTRVLEFAAVDRIEWRLNAPTAAWWGGWFERMIGVVKGLLKRILGKRCVLLDELSTLVAEVEDVVNNRPLTHMSEDPEDAQPLTPNHFIKNSGGMALPELDILDGSSRRVAYRKLQRKREELRSRFRAEYLSQLLHHHHIQKTTPLKVGDIVLIEHENMKRQDWLLATILAGIPGRDGITRAFRLKTKGGEVIRPVQRLYPMEEHASSPA